MKEIDYIYRDRSDFCVIALTGYTSTGCTRLSEYMENPDFLNLDAVRKPSSLLVSNPESPHNSDIFFKDSGSDISQSISEMIFSRKYNICYNFLKETYKPFTVIKYSKVLLLMALTDLSKNSTDADSLKNKFISLIEDKYQPSTLHDKKYREIKNEQPWANADALLEDISFEPLLTEINNLNDEDLKEGDKYDQRNKKIADIFFGRDGQDSFDSFYKVFTQRLFHTDYYSACFFYHRLGFQLRKTGRVEDKYEKILDTPETFKHVYDVVKYINRIVKGIRFPIKKTEDAPEGTVMPVSPEKEKISDPRGCRVVIDSVRNSLEARYIKERYSAFYLIAVHDEEDRAREHLKTKLDSIYDIPEDKKDGNWRLRLNTEVDCIFELGKNEQKKDHFEAGKFSAPNTEQCVADAEIHIINSDITDIHAPYFQSMAEQWMKFASLILHPGIITPSPEERCMVVAYTAKFNSGCLSRQVGAVITNKAHSIRSIGWNDVPYGQVPCSLRSLYDYPEMGKSEPERLKYVYSDFERGDYKYKDMFSFKRKVLIKYRELGKHGYDSELNGLPLPYCFKSLHNEFEENKNQVHTRSLHAEENAMLQIARFGGEGLENGIIYVTASPCELCCKKLYQIGVRKIIYIDEYPGISRQNIISIGYKRPDLKQFQGAYGVTYFKLYQPIMSQKEELSLRLKEKISPTPKTLSSSIKKILEKDSNLQFSSKEEFDAIVEMLQKKCPPKKKSQNNF